MTGQLKFVLIFVFMFAMLTPCCFAQQNDSNEDQLAFKSMHIFNLKAKYSVDELQIGLEKFNKLFVKLGHPDCYYRLWESSGEKKHEGYLWESNWSSKSVYDEIHKNAEYRKLIRVDFIGLRKMFKDHTKYQYYELPFNAAL